MRVRRMLSNGNRRYSKEELEEFKKVVDRWSKFHNGSVAIGVGTPANVRPDIDKYFKAKYSNTSQK